MAQPTGKKPWVLFLLVLVFAGPILFAYVLNVFSPAWLPFGASNHGELIRPAHQVDVKALKILKGSSQAAPIGTVWTLVYVASGRCDGTCQLALLELRQARIALGKDADRLQVMLLHHADEPPDYRAELEANPTLTVALGDRNWIPSLKGQVNYIVLVDPQGYAVIRYPPASPAKGVLKDLKRLLKISKIG